MTTAPSFFHNQNNTLFPKVYMSSNCVMSNFAIPLQPTVPEPKFLDNWFNGNNTNINTCSKPKNINTVALIRPM